MCMYNVYNACCVKQSLRGLGNGCQPLASSD